MSTQSLKAADNPALANGMISQALAAPATTIEQAVITPPSNNLVTLPGGYVTAAGEVIKTVEVRELTGRDEEAIARSGASGRVFQTILSRGTVRVGDMKATEGLLDELLSGDRDAIMLGIYKATFGSTTELAVWCNGCKEAKEVAIDIDEDIKTKTLGDPVNDRYFTVRGKSSEYLVSLPTGAVQKEIANNLDKNGPELITILLEGTVLEIDGKPMLSKSQVGTLGVLDRRAIADAITERTPGPKMENTTIECSDCGGEVVVPINFGALFRF